MAEFKTGIRMNFLDVQREFMEKNGIDENNGEVLSEVMVLLFGTDKKGRLVSNPRNRLISLDRDCREEVHENELWICHVTMKTGYLGYARPLRRIGVPEIIGMSDQMRDIADFLWMNGRKEVLKYLNPRIESEIQPALEQRISELEAEYSDKAAGIAKREAALSLRENSLASEKEGLKESGDRFREEYMERIAELEKQERRFKTEIEKLVRDKSTIMDYYETQNANLRAKISELTGPKSGTAEDTGVDERNELIAGYTLENHRLREELHMMRERMDVMRRRKEIENSTGREDAVCPAQKVIRITDTEFECPFMDEGRYSVRINADVTRLRFIPDTEGTAVCRNGTISVPNLGRINARGSRTGELNWRMVDSSTLEVSI
ncbi:MAG: hypothetical protein GX137_06630 [Thermoplasmatales archaeon]|nr:hypothetical protein [Thermoplasmatales archaeon]